MISISEKKFEEIVSQAIDSLPEKFKNKLNNVAIFIEDEPSNGQLKKINLKKDDLLFGLFEGFAQAKRLNFGPVLPDRVTIFRKAILSQSDDFKQAEKHIVSTLKHEIAHHFGSNETGARHAGQRR